MAKAKIEKSPVIHIRALRLRLFLNGEQRAMIKIIRERNAEIQKLVQDALTGKYLEEEKGDG